MELRSDVDVTSGGRQILRYVMILLTTVSGVVTSSTSEATYLQYLNACDRSVPLGMISGEIKDWQLSTSSTYPSDWDRTCHERYARLYQPNGHAWCAKYKTSSEWLQIDLGVAAKVTGVMTQGRSDGEEWVTSYVISYSLDAYTWKYAPDFNGNRKVFQGNTDAYSTRHVYLNEPVMARFVKFHTLTWHQHPSMRVEIIGCQACKSVMTLPPFVRVTASSEASSRRRRSCKAEDGLIFTDKAWCAKRQDGDQWLQFDIGPASLVTGVVTRGRGDTGKRQWVTRYKLAYSNDTRDWMFYNDASHLDPKEFGGNSDKTIERYHFLNSPFVARYIRLYPVGWSNRISMRAALLGCPYTGKCKKEFMRVYEFMPCVENVAYKKSKWVNSFRRSHSKRHVGQAAWLPATPARDVTSGDDADHVTECVQLSSLHVDRPTLKVDLGRRMEVSGVVVTGQKTTNGEAATFANQWHEVDRLDIYVGGRLPSAKNAVTSARGFCGSVTRVNGALYRSTVHVQCRRAQPDGRPLRGRFVYIEIIAQTNRINRVFTGVICDVMVYQ